MTLAIDQLWRLRAEMLDSASLTAESLVAPGAEPTRWWAWPSGLLLSVGFTLAITLLAVYVCIIMSETVCLPAGFGFWLAIVLT